MSAIVPRSTDVDHLNWLGRFGGNPEFRGRRVLDLGCGSGFLCALVARHGALQAIGVDLMPPDAPADAAHPWTYVKLDLEADDWDRPVRAVAGLGGGDGVAAAPSLGFDWVFAFDVLEHLTAPARFLTQIRAVLAPGGRLFLTTPNVNSWERVVRGARWSGATDPQHKTLFTSYSLAFLLQRCGFRAARVRAPLRRLLWMGPLCPPVGAQLVAVAQA